MRCVVDYQTVKFQKGFNLIVVISLNYNKCSFSWQKKSRHSDFVSCTRIFESKLAVEKAHIDSDFH